MKFAVVDVETTGLDPVSERITELGIVIIHDGSIVSEYSWLINPAKPVPASITRLTGISNEMVRKQPVFGSLAEIINDLLKDHILVGHNIHFDFSFLKSEMNRCGISFTRKTICTREFSELMMPGRPSYSLKSICRIFGIKNHTPHRALSDARVTSEIFLRYYLEKGESFIQGLFEQKNISRLIPSHIKNIVYHELPSAPGVYYFIGKRNRPFYIGKAGNIRQRVLSHFRGDGNSLKILVLAATIRNIQFTETGNELVASLHEDHEIRHYWPSANNAQKSRIRRFGVISYLDGSGRWRLAVTKEGKPSLMTASFHQYHLAADCIRERVNKYKLDGNLCGIPSEAVCDASSHNGNFRKMLKADKVKPKTTSIYWFTGRHQHEKSFVLLENGFYKGIGFIEFNKIHDCKEYYRQLSLRYSSITTENITQKLSALKPDFTFTWENRLSYEIELPLMVPNKIPTNT